MQTQTGVVASTWQLLYHMVTTPMLKIARRVSYAMFPDDEH